jgi:hypothetical protein
MQPKVQERRACRVMSQPPSRRERPKSETEKNDERNQTCSRLCADGRRCQHVPPLPLFSQTAR